MKKIISGILICIMMLLPCQVFASTTILIDGEKIGFEAEPFITNGTTFVPMRAIFEKLGASVEWNGDTRTVTSRKDGIIISLTIDSKTAYKNGAPCELLEAPVIKDDFTMIPLRFVAESLGCDVAWEDSTKTVTITTTSIAGAKVGFVGDSICFGSNYEGGYARVLSDINSITAYNEGLGGATITRNVTWNENNSGLRPCIIDLLDNLPDDLDYLVIEGSVNDFWSHVALEGDADTSFNGAVNTLLQKAKAEYPDTKIGFVISHDAFTYNAEDGYKPYYEAVKAACGRFGVPYLDLYAVNNADMGVNVKDAEQKKLYFGTDAHPEGDGVHPNKFGYEEIYAKPIAQWIKTL